MSMEFILGAVKGCVCDTFRVTLRDRVIYNTNLRTGFKINSWHFWDFHRSK